MKKYLWMMLLIVFMGSLSFKTVIMAEETKGIKIDDKNFPDEHLRKAVYNWADRDGDYVLQPSEIERAKAIGISGLYEDEDDDYFSEVNLKGIEILKNLEDVYIATEQLKNKKNRIINFNILYQFKNLKRIEIHGDNATKRYDFSHFPKLRELRLSYVKDFKSIKIANKKLSKLEIKSVKAKSFQIKSNNKVEFLEIDGLETKKLDLSKMNKLSSLELYRTKINFLKFGKLKKLKRVNLQLHKKNGIRRLDLSGVKNLEDFSAWDLTKVKEIKFGALTSLKKIGIRAGEKKCNKALKKINLSEMKGLKVLIIKRMSKLNKIKICKNQKFKYFITENCKKLKQLDMKNCRVSKAFCIDKWTKVTNLNPIAKKHLKYN